MARLSIEQRIKIVEIFITTKSIVATQREFKKQLKLKKAPSGKAIREVVAKFQSTGSVKDQHRGASGRPSSVRNRDNIEKLEASFEEDPAMSNRKRAQAVDISCSFIDKKWTASRGSMAYAGWCNSAYSQRNDVGFTGIVRRQNNFQKEHFSVGSPIPRLKSPGFLFLGLL